MLITETTLAYPICHEGRLDAPKQGIGHDAECEEVAGSISIDARQTSVYCRAAHEQVDSPQNLDHDAVGTQNNMGRRAVTFACDFEESVCVWSFAFQLDGDNREQ